MTILIRPIQEKENDAVYQMFQDIPAEENYAQNKANGLSRHEFDEYCKLQVSYAKTEGLPADRVPQTLYIIFDDATPVGFGKFRPFLNADCIKRKVGNLAYMISPEHRHKGYATAFIAFLIERAQELGLTELEAATLQDNIFSQKTIEKNGGKIKEIDNGHALYTIPVNQQTR